MTDANDPNAQMVEPGVGEEDMDAFLKSLEDTDASVDLSRLMDNGEPEPEPEPEPEEPEPEPAEAQDAQDFFTINGEQWPRSEIERLYQFDRYLRDNPTVAQRVAEATRPRQE